MIRHLPRARRVMKLRITLDDSTRIACAHGLIESTEHQCSIDAHREVGA